MMAGGARALLVVLMAAVIVAWSPRYWPVALLHIGVFLMGIAWLGWILGTSGTPYWNVLFLPALVAGSWGAVQLVIGSSVYPFLTSRTLLYWSANALLLFLAAQFLREKSVLAGFLTGLIYFTGAVAVIGILQYYTSPYVVYWIFPLAGHVKAVGPFVYRNQFAALVEMVLPLALYRVMDERRLRWVFALLSAVMVAVVVATASRAGTILVGMEMLLMFAFGWWRGLVLRRTLALVFAQVLGLVLMLTVVVGFQDVWSRFHQSNPYALRGKLTESTLRMIATRPVMGYGLGTWPTVYPEFATFDNSLFANEAHNDWAQWTAEGGIPFGLSLVAIALGAVYFAWRALWGIGVVFVFLHSFIDYPTREPAVGAILFVLIGAMIATNAQLRSPAHRCRRVQHSVRTPALST